MAELSKREFTKSRHAQRRELHKSCQTVTKGTGWKSRTGVLLAERGGWFLAAHELTKIASPQTFVRLVVKPMAIDPLFWDLVGHPELRGQSLSFRYFGAMTVGVLILEELEVSEKGGTDEIARRMLAAADSRLQQIVDDWTSDDFLKGIAGKTGRYFTATVTTLLAEARYVEAQRLCDEAAARGTNGGFWSSKLGTFNEMVTRWIADHRAGENPPVFS